MPDAYLTNYRAFYGQPHTTGQDTSSYGVVIAAFAGMLTSAGWTIQASGDGSSSYNATGNVFTNTSPSAAGWGNARAWARLQDPAGVREIIIQNGGTIATFGGRLKYSAAAKFTAGSPSATVTPTAYDERAIFGCGTDATPVYTSFGTGLNPWDPTGSASRYLSPTKADRIVRGMASSSAPYGFWFQALRTYNSGLGSAKIRSFGFMMDPVNGAAPEDADPVVWHMGTSIGTNNTTQPFTPFSVYSSNRGGFSRDGSLALTWTWPNSYGTGSQAYQCGSFAHMSNLASGAVTFTNGSANITWPSHGQVYGSTVRFATAGTLPTGFTPYTATTGISYYIVSVVDANTITVSASPGGSAISASSAGSGTHTAYSQAFLYVQPAGYTMAQSGTAAAPIIHGYAMSPNPFNGKLDALPLCYMRTGAAATLPGIKGWSSLGRWVGTPRYNYDSAENKNWICVGALWLPWDGATSPIG